MKITDEVAISTTPEQFSLRRGKIEAMNKNGCSAQMWLLVAKHLAGGGRNTSKAIEELERAGADVNATDQDRNTALMYATGKNYSGALKHLGGHDTPTQTGMSIVAGEEHVGAIRELLKQGANKQARNKDGETAYAIWKQKNKDHPQYEEICELLKP